MPGEGKGDAHLGGEVRAVGARAEEVERRQRPVVGHGANVAEGIIGGKCSAAPGDELAELLEEVIGGESFARAAEREGGEGIGAGRAADAEINAAGINGFEEL